MFRGTKNVPNYDIPLVFADKLLDPTTGLLAFDTFKFNGLIGNVFLVNGKVQPYHPVQKRRYRFRLLDAGPSRFYEFFLTNPANLSQKIPFWVISNDGNLLPRPIQVTSYRIGVAERTDIIVDFKKIADRFGNPPVIRLENRLEQVNGRGPTGRILPAGRTSCSSSSSSATRPQTTASTRSRCRSRTCRRRRPTPCSPRSRCRTSPRCRSASPVRSGSSGSTASGR